MTSLGPVWGLGTVCGWALWTFLIGLTSRDFFLILLPAECLLFAAVVYRGVERWRAVLRENLLRVERLEEEANSLTQEEKRLRDLAEAGEERLQRYQKLRQLANRLALVLPLEELLEALTVSTGPLVPSADLILLYLVNPEGLHLELRKVWRRIGTATVKAKRGDLFDHWVMKQGQALLVEQVGHDFRFAEASVDLDGRSLGSVLAVPLATKNQLLGVLRFESPRSHGLSTDDLRMAGIVGDMAALAIENGNLYGQMAHLAMTDDLTGLLVKEYFMKRLEDEITAARREAKALSVLLIDIDHFKVYNDSFGHSAGDKLLRQIGQTLSHLTNSGNLAGRFGGEEFVCLLCHCGLETAIRRAEGIRARIEATPVELRRTLAHATVSLGVATFPQDGLTSIELLRAADRRLYLSKQGGRNRVCGSG